MKPNRFFTAAVYLAALALFPNGAPRAIAQPAHESAGDQVAETIHNQLLEMKPRFTNPEGLIVSVKGGTVYIENSSGAIVEQGSVLNIFRETEEITHPVTGEKLGVIKEKIAMVETVSSDGKLIVAKPLSNKGEIKPGDKIGSATGKRPRVAVVNSIDAQSYDLNGFAKSLARKLAEWKTVSWVPNYAVERYLYDNNISGAALLGSGSMKSLGTALKADYIILITLQEKDGAILSDITLSEVNKGNSLASQKGLISNLTPLSSSPKAVEKTSSPAASPPSTQAAATTSAKAPATKPLKRKGAATVLASFDAEVSAILSHDLDNDGVNEVVVGFERRVTIFKAQDGGLVKVWEKDMGRLNQITGLAAGDFNGNGVVEVYVNGFDGDTISSMILESVGSGGYQTISENMVYFFYVGFDGNLYGQRQAANRSLTEKIYLLKWSGSKLEPSPFIMLPRDMRLSGLAFFDIDGDGATDVAGYGSEYSLQYYSSKKRKWVGIPGRYGGSNIFLVIPTAGDEIVVQEFQPVIMALRGTESHKRLLVVHNLPTAGYFVEAPTFNRSQMYIMEHDGVAYFKKAQTPLADGVIQGVARFDKNRPNLVLISKTESSFFGKAKSKIILMDLDRY